MASRAYRPGDFPEDFGPEIVLEPGKELQDVNSEEYEFYQKTSRVRHFGFLYLATAQLSPFAPNSIIGIALGTRLCM